MTQPKIKNAIISVSDKTNLYEFASFLTENGVNIFSSGNTAQFLKDKNLPVIKISDYTGFAEILSGRVKTLHPKIHAGILANRENKEHMDVLKMQNISQIDMVVVNLYPFEKLLEENADKETLIENIDIGGVALVRAGAKNFDSVGVVTDIDDYQKIISDMKENNGTISKFLRKKLAKKAFIKTSLYDANIANWLCQKDDELPDFMFITGQKIKNMRYGENPHQKAAFYKSNIKETPSLYNCKQLHGKELSYNNISDANRALNLILEFEEKPTVAIIKHGNPCGVASDDSLKNAYQKAFACDKTSAFGSIIASNKKIDKNTSVEISNLFVELVIAPDFEKEALEILKNKKNIRLLKIKDFKNKIDSKFEIKQVRDGFLAQEKDNINFNELDVVTKKNPTENQIKDIKFANKIVKHVSSNAVLFAKDEQTIGIGAGQMSRVDSSKIAIRKAKEANLSLKNSVVASDAFFPFADSLVEASKAGAVCVVQPGGSIRDKEVIKAADENDIAMVFTNIRHFKH